MAGTFAERVRQIVAQIPAGETLSYGEVARRAGSPNAARAVGAVMRKNYDPKVPCHRVVGADGSMRGYNRGGADAKRSLLAREAAAC